MNFNFIILGTEFLYMSKIKHKIKRMSILCKTLCAYFLLHDIKQRICYDFFEYFRESSKVKQMKNSNQKQVGKIETVITVFILYYD